MDQQQYDIACEIVDQDCTLTDELKNGKGNFCVIGGLYTTINPDWAASDILDTWQDEGEIYKAVADAFGIDVNLLWIANDDALTIPTRRKHVREVLSEQLDVNS